MLVKVEKYIPEGAILAKNMDIWKKFAQENQYV